MGKKQKTNNNVEEKSYYFLTWSKRFSRKGFKRFPSTIFYPILPQNIPAFLIFT